MNDDLWRFRAEILRETDPDIDYQWLNPVQIRAEGEVVGYASIFRENTRMLADCAVRYDDPTRLDVESGQKLWALPVALVRLGNLNRSTQLTIRGLELRKDCDDQELTPIGVFAL